MRATRLIMGLLAGCAIPTSAWAADDAAPADAPEAIVVTATRSGTPIESLPISVSVVNEAELGRQLAYSTSILRGIELAVPGLNPQNDTRLGCFANVRGRTTSFQINGVPVNQDLRQSNCNAMFQLSPFAIERIEVVRGGTALYGAGAPGGIINLITRRAKGSALEVDVVAQTSFNTSDTDETFTTDLYAGAGQQVGDGDYYVGVAYQDFGARRTPNGGFVPTRQFESLSFNGSAGYKLRGTGELRLTATHYRETPDQEYASDGTQVRGARFGNVVPIASHPQIGQASDRLTTLALSYTDSDVLGHELAISGFMQQQRYKQRDNSYSLAAGNSFLATNSENDRYGFRSTLVKRLSVGDVGLVGSYGFDFTNNRYYRPTVNAATGAIIGFISPETILRTYALFGQGEADFGALRLTGGVRQEWYRGEVGDKGYTPTTPQAATPGDFGKSDLTLWNLGAVYDVTSAVQLYGGFSQGAELSQLARAANRISVPSRITPEPATSNQLEVGLRGKLDRLRFELAAFRSRSKKAALLQADASCAGQPLCSLIPLRTAQRFHGVEASADWSATDALDLRGVVTWQRGKVYEQGLGRFVEYSATKVAPFRATAGATVRPAERWSVGAQATYYGKGDFYTPGEQALGYVATDSQFLLDADVRLKALGGEFYVAASNLLDDEYVNVGNQANGAFYYYQAEGRRVTLGYAARF